MTPSSKPGYRTSDNNSEVALYSWGKKNRIRGEKLPAVGYKVPVTEFRDPLGAKKALKLKGLPGTHEDVKKYVGEDPKMPALLSAMRGLAEACVRKGNATWISVGFEDHHGNLIAPAVAELVAESLIRDGFRVSVVHHGLGGK